MRREKFIVREVRLNEFASVGELMVILYTQLDGFLTMEEHPDYYKMLVNVGDLTNQPKTQLLVAVSENDELAGAVVYLGDIRHYGAGGILSNEKNAAGFRLLAVDPVARGQGIGKLFTNTCIQIAKAEGHKQIVIHSTNAMKVAWGMYERLGFVRAEDLDFFKDDDFLCSHMAIYSIYLKRTP